MNEKEAKMLRRVAREFTQPLGLPWVEHEDKVAKRVRVKAPPPVRLNADGTRKQEYVFESRVTRVLSDECGRRIYKALKRLGRAISIGTGPGDPYFDWRRNQLGEIYDKLGRVPVS